MSVKIAGLMTMKIDSQRHPTIKLMSESSSRHLCFHSKTSSAHYLKSNVTELRPYKISWRIHPRNRR